MLLKILYVVSYKIVSKTKLIADKYEFEAHLNKTIFFSI